MKNHFTPLSLSVLLVSIGIFQGTNRPSARERNEMNEPTLPVNAYHLSTVQTEAMNSSEELNRSSWFKEVVNKIQQEEYHLTYSESHNAYQSPNRSQNLRFIYHSDGFTARSRTTKIPLFAGTETGLKESEKSYREIEDWQITLVLEKYGRKAQMKVFTGTDLLVSANTAEIEDEKVKIEYTNTDEGMRQNFIIKEKPEGNGQIRVRLKAETELRARIGAEGVVFANAQSEEKMKYNGLKVWDNKGDVLAAHFAKADSEKEFEIVVNDDKAAYPITIDPLSTTSNWTAESDQAGANFGVSVSTAGDVNGDGYSDVIVGAYLFDNGEFNEGRAFVYHGSASGLSTTANWTAESNQAAARFGWSVSTAGDVNGDGYSDVIVGASAFDNGETDEGRAFVYHGSASGLSTTANWTAESNQATALFGWSVSTAGDVNGDGYSDVIVGAYAFDNGETYEGRAFVYHGSSSGLSTTANWTAESDQASASFGNSVSTAGDINGDGYSDVIVGAAGFDIGESNEGRAFVYHGSSSGLSTTANWTAESDQAFANFGVSVSTAGDVNGDGYSDVIVGAYLFDNGESNEGRAFVYHGSSSGLSLAANWTAESNQAGANFGVSVSTAGDVNGDGYSDVIVGASAFDNGETDEGRAFVYHGSSSGLSTTANWTAESNQAGARFGYSVSTAGDVNGDGYSDVIVGAYFFDNGESNEGRAFVYHGSASGLSTTANWTAESDQAGARFGYSVSTAGDVNGDGYSDVIVGAYLFDNGETDEGRAFVYHGSASGLSTTANWTAESNQVGARFGVSVSTAGDVNGDGYSDVIVGANLFDNGETDEGRAFVYHGSSSGLSTTANWTAESNQVNASFGISVSTAGDVNGDGYSDVIVGAYAFDNGETDEGRAFVYHGSSSGLSTTDAWIAESNQAFANFGFSVSTAGDVNGDGYSDVIVGAYAFDNGETDEGRAFVYFGNGGDGMDLKPRQWRTDLTTPVVAPLKTRSTSQAGVGLLGRTFFGRSDVKVQFEVKALGTPFDGSGLTETSTWTDVGTAGAQIDELISGLSERTMYKWRARVKYLLSDGAPQPYGRWIYPNANGGMGESDFQVSDDDNPLPVTMVSFIATASRLNAELKWRTEAEVENYGFEVERRNIQKSEARSQTSESGWQKIGFVAGSGTSSSLREYSFEDKNLAAGRYAYRIKQIDNDGTFAYTGAVEVEVGLAPRKFTLSQNYPNPFNPTTTIEFTVPEDGKTTLKAYDVLGREVATIFDGDVKAGYYQKATFDASRLASGIYIARLQFGGKQLLQKMLLMK